ncbi:MAG: hypothetical protein AAB263_15290, partial [Planctomycetota bacterium]
LYGNDNATLTTTGAVLKARWKFDETAGIIAANTVSTALNGTLSNMSINAWTPWAASGLIESDLIAWLTAQDKTKSIRTDYAYDFRGQLLTATTYNSLDASGNGIPTDTGNVIRRYVYDQRGYLLQTVDGRGTATNPTQPNTPYATTYTYDGLGRLLTSTQWIASGSTRSTTSAYDDAGNKVTTTAANGLVVTQTYDKTGRLISQSQSGTVLGTTTYQYDAAGRLRLSTDPTGLKTHFIYDEASRKVADIDGTGTLTEYVYNSNNQVAKTIHYANRPNTTQLASLVDAGGNPTNVFLVFVRPTLDNTNDRVTYYLYDSANRLVLQIDPTDTSATQGYATKTSYDGANRVIETVRYKNPISTTAITLDTLASNITVTEDSTTDRHVRSFYENDGRLQSTLDAEGYLTENQYDSAGELTHTIRYAKASTSTTRLTDSFSATKTNIINQSSATQGV